MKILVAFDGSDQSYHAFNFAVDYYRMRSGSAVEIVVLAVAQPPEPLDIVEVKAIIDSCLEHYEELFARLKERVAAQNISFTTAVVVGHPADQIVRYAADKTCDMIVMGHRGRSKIENWLLGSVSKRVASHAPCTVVIVK